MIEIKMLTMIIIIIIIMNLTNNIDMIIIMMMIIKTLVAMFKQQILHETNQPANTKYTYIKLN
jgi:hypothetical protein